MPKEDITKYGKRELLLIVRDTKEYYKLKDDIKIFKVLTSKFKYTLEQITYLIKFIDEL